MNIDRSRFLVLTSVISAAVMACTIQNQKADPTAHPESGPGQTDDGTQPSSPSTKNAVLDASRGATTDASTSSDAGDAAADATKDAGPACLGDEGPAPECAGSQCEWDCSNQTPRWKAAVARDIANCLEMSPACEGASAPCVESALPKACDDATAAAFCQPIVDSCAGNAGWEMQQNDCVAMAKALSADGRAELLSCVNEGIDGYCRWDSAWCLEAMKW